MKADQYHVEGRNSVFIYSNSYGNTLKKKPAYQLSNKQYIKRTLEECNSITMVLPW